MSNNVIYKITDIYSSNCIFLHPEKCLLIHRWSGFPIKVNAPSNSILLGTKGKTSAATINKLVKEAIRKDYLGVMVWYASVIDGLQYAKGSWDASTSRSAQEAYVDGMNKFREVMNKS